MWVRHTGCVSVVWVWEGVWEGVWHCHCSPAALTSNDQVPKEQPARDKWFFGGARRFLHDANVRGVEAEGSGGQPVCDQVHPEELDGDESFRHAQSGCEEDAAGDTWGGAELRDGREGEGEEG